MFRRVNNNKFGVIEYAIDDEEDLDKLPKGDTNNTVYAILRKDGKNLIYLYSKEVEDYVLINGDLEEINTELESINEQLETKANKTEIGTPLTASSVSGMTDTTKVYVNTTDGNWYSWNGATWEIGGVYNSQAIGKDSVKIDMIETKMKDTLGTYIFGALGKNLNLSKAWSYGTGT